MIWPSGLLLLGSSFLVSTSAANNNSQNTAIVENIFCECNGLQNGYSCFHEENGTQFDESDDVWGYRCSPLEAEMRSICDVDVGIPFPIDDPPCREISDDEKIPAFSPNPQNPMQVQRYWLLLYNLFS